MFPGVRDPGVGEERPDLAEGEADDAVHPQADLRAAAQEEEGRQGAGHEAEVTRG